MRSISWKSMRSMWSTRHEEHEKQEDEKQEHEEEHDEEEHEG
jgi:hypothetical protein